MRLQDKVAIITGAGQGIGEASAVLFAKEGASVVVVDVNDTAGGKVVTKIRNADGEATFLKADVSNSSSVRSMVDATIEKYGKINVLFNNAGLIFGDDTIINLSEEHWDRTINVNLKGVFLCTKYVVPHMIKQKEGTIINTGSIAGLVGRTENCAYCASKGGVVILSKQLALDLAPYNIRVNSINPGFTSTPLIEGFIAAQSNPEQMRRTFESWHPLGRFARPEEIAQAALFLASAESSYVTGSALAVDGGFTAQ